MTLAASVDIQPSRDEMRLCIKEGRCPWCGKGGFSCLGQHTKAHHISAADIREIAFLIKTDPICTPEEHEKLSTGRKALIAAGLVSIQGPDVLTIKGKTPQLSEAGLERLRQLGRDHTGRSSSRPHPCPVCGTMIPHAKPRCCCEACRKTRMGNRWRRQQ